MRTIVQIANSILENEEKSLKLRHLDAARLVNDGLDGHSSHYIHEQQANEHKQNDHTGAEASASTGGGLVVSGRRGGRVGADARQLGLELEVEESPEKDVVQGEARHVRFLAALERHVCLVVDPSAVHKVARVVAQHNAVRVGSVHEPRGGRVAHVHARVIVPSEYTRARRVLRVQCIRS